MGLFSSKKCEVCGSKDSASMNVIKILDHQSRPYTYDANATYSLIPDGFTLAFSDVNIKSPHGTMYFYKLGNSNAFHLICSLQCAFNYSVKESALVIYKDPDNNTILRGITPQILKINKGLGIPEIAKYRGQPVSRKG